MVAILIGLLLVAGGLYCVLPLAWTLGWWEDFLVLLRGGVPFLLFLVGLIAILVGLADIKDRAETRKLERERASRES
ncbi:hypothetical protein [Spirochaeta thermophila]|uniref:Magnetosome protein MamI n=2 Tax=Winmispira thermophila TaxID=154 RepID=G0GFL9_WINT7|nr:hypothetical protein [Spirochaeta thermophila]ADN03049.1 hypothetical protein STHERM_c21180 [Spirochaeta thermophila DSM 6192]AEJ62418.1 hypothetical protein Spith_2163 [Spirochaeta thermophila DSM 6578]